MFTNLWRYRGFILGLVTREFQARYLDSVLGSLWAVLHPLTIVLIYVVIFGHLMHTRLPGAGDHLAYGIFLCAGVLTWNTFAEVITRCVHVFIEHANLIKNVTFPRATLAAAVLLSAMVNFAIVFVVFLFVLVVSGRSAGWALLALFPLLAVQLCLALGIGVGLGVLNVFFRDVGHAVSVLLQLWFWLTPIVYPLSIVGAPVDRVLRLNPLTAIVVAYQDILVGARWPEWSQLLAHAALAVLCLAVGAMTARRLGDEMVDYL
jgi:lipopolysaccharide transport system permease protein